MDTTGRKNFGNSRTARIAKSRKNPRISGRKQSPFGKTLERFWLMFHIGIDLGGTKIEGIVLDDRGKELFRKRIETQQEGGFRHILDRIHGLYGELAKAANGDHAFGIGTPGATSPRTGLLKNSNTVCMN